jgi:hypothetical protein
MSVAKPTYKQDKMLPPQVAAVLSIRDSRGLPCPQDILTRIESLKIGKMVYNYKGSPQGAPSSPIANSGNGNTGGGNSWRSRNNNGFRTANPTNQSNSWDRGSSLNIRRVASDLSSSSPKDEEYRGFRANGRPSPGSNTPVSPFPPGGRYVSSIVSEKKVEDRIIGHIRSKLNKFSTNNYDGVKSFLEQIMTSGETEFLSEFMDLLFMKAASEEMYCGLYAKLLSELTDKFPFLKTEISNIYTNYISIFSEAKDIPDQGAADYKKFLDAQEKKKYRKGYSHFLAEIYNKNLLPHNSMEVIVSHILESLSDLEKDTSNTLLVEEYLVSISKIISTLNVAKSSPLPPYLVNAQYALKKTLEKPKEDTPGYTMKSRFKLMDIIEALPPE